ncbi:mannitol-1-phosphate 5-dehydrogenase [Sutcliffiella horikoshii]|uniref:Mannitol-1-phosphate 5-dehydrogenase n=1 Tax=Sutcliffiella horikoshii TaxID=79883 RepID=A0A1Y0CK08_9BACI|nr:mannitol-1-phosphate 5-dehydrogenase [Sutcliffiella horikoshii]ART75255.1 mannitol-1-phosphate 5-dehydrogenase [Sutcliffiella horikoshii]TYS58629.1 mannitol-1-phosphate 5-dehydrogenase [Sutcliffiella horikoshii]
MKALHYGAGNIGRGFIGALLYQAGYATTFVDVNSEIVDLLNEKKEYRVVLADKTQDELVIRNVSAINSMEKPEELEAAIVEADIITTAVGPSILPIIAKSLASGLRKRVEINKAHLNIIACENLIGGSSLLKQHVYEGLTPEEVVVFDELFAFPDAAVDRIVPNQTNADKLMVTVEPYYEWVVDESALVGETPAVEGITFVRDLTPYIERKLFTVNTGHATVAYLGYKKGCKTIDEALTNEEVRKVAKSALKETGMVLVGKYGFDKKEHEAYIVKILSRFENSYITDDVTRVGRAPLRKLGGNDRLVAPAKQYLELFGHPPANLIKAIAAAITYDGAEDEEAQTIQQIIRSNGLQKAITEITGLETDNPITMQIMKEVGV